MNTTKDVEHAIRTLLTGERIESSYVDDRLNDGALEVEDGEFRFRDSSGLRFKSADGDQLAKAAADYIKQSTPEEHKDVASKEHMEALEQKKRESGQYRL